jgi:hypothetical protein
MGIKDAIFSVSGVALIATIMLHSGFTIYSYNHSIDLSGRNSQTASTQDDGIKIEITQEDDELLIEREDKPEDYETEDISNLSKDVNDARDIDNDNFRFNSDKMNQEIRDKVAGYTQKYFEDAAKDLNLDEIPDFPSDDIDVHEYEEGVDLDKGSQSDKNTVTVAYSLPDGRFFRRDPRKPNYLCEGGGKVHINLSIDPIGNVKVEYDPTKSSGASDCHIENAVRYAKGLMVTRKNSAPRAQSGWIVYTFVSQ